MPLRKRNHPHAQLVEYFPPQNIAQWGGGGEWLIVWAWNDQIYGSRGANFSNQTISRGPNPAFWRTWLRRNLVAHLHLLQSTPLLPSPPLTFGRLGCQRFLSPKCHHYIDNKELNFSGFCVTGFLKKLLKRKIDHAWHLIPVRVWQFRITHWLTLRRIFLSLVKPLQNWSDGNSAKCLLFIKKQTQMPPTTS